MKPPAHLDSPDLGKTDAERTLAQRACAIFSGVARTTAPYALLFALTACSDAGLEADGRLAGEWVDLTHEFSSETLYWPTAPRFELTVESRGEAEGGYWYEAYSFRGAEHGGTHIDAPVHFAKGRLGVHTIPLERLIGPACVIDVSAAALQDADYQVTVDDIQAWEEQHGVLPSGAIVLLHTGYAAFWPDAARYFGTAERGADAVAQLHFPGLHPQAARWLASERRLDAIGIDTPSIDFGQSTLFETHRVLFEQDIPAFENVAHLDRLPATGASVIALPMKIRGGSGAPLRIVALLPRQT